MSKESFEKPGGEARGLHLALRLIATEAGPAAGAAVAAATSVMTGGILAALLALRELFNRFQELRKAADAFKDKQAETWMAVEEGAHAAKEAAQEFADKLREANDKSDALKTSFGGQRDEDIHAINELTDQILQLNTALGIHTATAATTKAIGDVTAAGGIGALVPAAGAAYGDILAGRETARDAQTLQLLGALVTALGGNKDRFNALLVEAISGQQAQADAIAQLQAQMANMAQRTITQ